ncbi:MAG: bifunctional homocysteine S-methyltransferase/methylenetetrahydrofolate reductase, partial [Proteobacteria bacterium]|nr:bifunctional homocysteine S-methyltransferase/methylenetetrahydrofolate reductase [Pseudomonadota bacterium]
MYDSKQANSKFLEFLSSGPVVFDGAMGTMLYDMGVYFEHSFEELCLIRPQLVELVHNKYIDIGVDVITTNTYGANSFILNHFDLENKVTDICRAAVQIAQKAAKNTVFVAGSIGPTGLLPKDLMNTASRKKALDAFRCVALALYEAGADLLLFETFRHLGELELAIEATYGLRVPIVGQIAFDEFNKSGDGALPFEVAQRLACMNVDMVGANCLLGPEGIHVVGEEMLKAKKPVLLQPNVGFPRNIEGRTIYQSSPETFGVCAKRAFKLGIAAYGGCCGTTPSYIQRVVSAARMIGNSGIKISLPSEEKLSIKVSKINQVNKDYSRSLLAEKIAKKEFIVSVEIIPPVGIDLKKAFEQLSLLENSGISFVNIPDGPRAMVRMSNLAFCKLILDKTKIEPILHVCGRDKNILALQASLLGADALGIRNTVIVTGDPPKIGDYPDATAVFDLNSIGILSMASNLNSGIDPAGKEIGGNTNLVLITGAEPQAFDFNKEIDRLKEKIDAGAEAVMTQPVYDLAIFDRFLEATNKLKIPVIMGVLP